MKLFRPFAAVGLSLFLTFPMVAQVTLTVTPSSVGSDYLGPITVQITGLTNGETVKLGKFFDANSNGVVDSPDSRVMGITLRDGQVSVIAGVTNINVPIDSDAAAGSMRVQFWQSATGFEQRMPGQYIFRLISPTDRFAPVSQLWNITNAGFGQSISGTVYSGGNPIPYAWVVLFPPGGQDMSYPAWSAVADANGHYVLNVPVGTYSPMAAKSNYVSDLSALQSVSVGAGVAATADLALIPATVAISGGLFDAAHTNRAFTAIGIAASSSDNKFAFALTDTNGMFSIPVTPGQWQLDQDERNNLAMFRYLRPGHVQADASAGSVAGLVVNMTRATALIYGTMKDALGAPLAGVSVTADNNNEKGIGMTDQNGNFTIGVTGGDWNLFAEGSEPAIANLVFSGMDTVSINDGAAFRRDLVGVNANYQISGYLKDLQGNPISGVSIWASATINGTSFNLGTQGTDGSGFYSIAVPSGQWTVGVSSGGGNNSLDPQYLSPQGQTVTISNQNATVNFVAVAATSHISGFVTNQDGIPISGVWVNAAPNSGGGQYFLGANTDGSGFYSFGVPNGTWDVAVSCDGGNQSLHSHGYACLDQQIVTVSNSNSTVSFSASYCPLFQVTTTSLSNGQVGSYYSTMLSAAGCYAPFTWSLASGSNPLPPGLQLSPDGTLNGNPGQAGNFSFRVHVADSNGQSAESTIALTIVAPVNSGPRLALGRWSGGRFDLQVSGVANQLYTVQYSTNLVSSNWIPMFTGSSPAGLFSVSDLSATNTLRFYRVISVP